MSIHRKCVFLIGGASGILSRLSTVIPLFCLFIPNAVVKNDCEQIYLNMCNSEKEAKLFIQVISIVEETLKDF
jgi:hypothetical protein